MAQREIKEATLRAKLDDQLSRGAEAAEKAVRKLDNAMGQAEATVKKVGLSTDQMARKWDENAAAAAKVEAANRRYEKALESINQRLAANQLAEAQAQEYVRRANIDREKAVAAAERYAAGMKAMYSGANDNGAFRGHSASIAAASKSYDTASASANMLKGNLANLGYQLQDTAVQAQMGASWFTIIAQQAPQAASGFGAVGVAIGTAVAVAAVAAGVFFNVGDGLSDAERAANSYEETMQSVKSIIDEAAESGKRLRQGLQAEVLDVADLNAHYRTLSETMLGVERIRLASEKNKVIEGLADQRKAVADLIGTLDGLDIAADKATALSDAVNKARGQLGAPLMPTLPQEIKDLSGALKDFKASSPNDIEAIGRLAVALDKVAQAGGPMADEAKKAAAALVEPARQSVQLSDQLKRVEDGMTAVSAAAMKIPLPGRKPGENGPSVFETAGKDAKSFKDILDDLAGQKLLSDNEKGRNAWALIGKTLEDAQTPAEKFKKKTDEIRNAIGLVTQHVDDMGVGLKALSPEQLTKIEEHLKRQDPAWQEAEKAAKDYQQKVSQVAESIPDIDEDAPISDEALTLFMEAFQ